MASSTSLSTGSAKTLGDHVRMKRLELGMLQKEVAQRLGVNKASVCNWENGCSSPMLHLIPRVNEFLGYVPFLAAGSGLGERIIQFRRTHGIRQDELASQLGVDPSTLARWERSERKPLKPNLEKLDVVLGSLPTLSSQ